MKKKKGGKKLKIGKKGGLKMRAKKAKKKVVDAVKDVVDEGEDAVEDAVEDATNDGEDAVNDAGNPLPKMAQLPRMVDELRARVDKIGIQVEGLLAEKPTIASSAMDEEEDDGDLGI